MATLAAIRAGVRATLRTVLGTGVEIYDKMPAKPVLPAICVLPDEADFVLAMNRGTDKWTFNVIVLVPSGDAEVGQSNLDPYVTGAGSSSIRQAIFNNRTLGLADGTEAHVAALLNYGGNVESVSEDHVAATLHLIVSTPGTA